MTATIFKPVECRWGILGCGPETANFVAELQAGNLDDHQQIRHTIIAISSRSTSTSQDFIDSHIHIPAMKGSSSTSSKVKTIEAFGTSTELHAHPLIDSIFIASPQHSRYQEALSALRGGKSVLISKPLAITSIEARELCDLASRKDKQKVKWLGFIMRPNAENKSLLEAANECAKGRASDQVQSPKFSWSESLAVLEALDEVREAGAMRLPCEEEMMSRSFPSKNGVTPREGRGSLTIDTTKRRPIIRMGSSSDVGQEEPLSSATLRSQLQELRHVLRQRNALITSMEMKGGSGSIHSKATSRKSMPPRSSTTLHTPQVTGLRRRTSSLDHNIPAAPYSDTEEDVSDPAITLNGNSYNGMPLTDVINTMEPSRLESPSAASFGRRRRKDASGNRSSSSPDRSNTNNSLGLTTVQEISSSNIVLGEGFLAPTIASENRRLATANGSPRLATSNGLSALGSPILSPGSGSGKGSSKVIENLMTDLNSARGALDETKVHLRTSQRTILTLQRSLDETKETLGRSRSENERLGQMMTRRERQIQEALERARKAEVESKELGKSSREWGARVRKIEAELGEERVLKQRADVQYETISSAWKQIREAWEKEMKELRESQGDAVRRNRDEVQKMLAKFKAAEESWRGREEEGKVLKGIIQELEMERQRAVVFVEGPVKELMTQLKQYEKHTNSQNAAVEAVQSELNRISRLMRASS